MSFYFPNIKIQYNNKGQLTKAFAVVAHAAVEGTQKGEGERSDAAPIRHFPDSFVII